MPATSLGEGTPPKTGSSNDGGARPLPTFIDFHFSFMRFHLKREQSMHAAVEPWPFGKEGEFLFKNIN